MFLDTDGTLNHIVFENVEKHIKNIKEKVKNNEKLAMSIWVYRMIR